MILATLALTIAAATPTRWLGVALGEPIAAVRATLGDPLDEKDLGDGLIKSVYLAADNSAFVGVDRKNGVVVMISLQPVKGSTVDLADPYGIRLGDLEQAVQKTRGKPDSTDNGDGADRWIYGSAPAWRYIFHNGVLGEIIAIDPNAAPSAAAAADPPVHSGSSMADAIVIKGENEMTGVEWEYAYLAFHPCASGKRAMVKQALLTSNKRSYDLLTTKCPGQDPQEIYFDISDYIGKI